MSNVKDERNFPILTGSGTTLFAAKFEYFDLMFLVYKSKETCKFTIYKKFPQNTVRKQI